jgi:NAD(P)-dependent dehydrogenase (short-subunit alcohol dehydrogenase family)
MARTALVTGGARGLGLARCRALARAGWTVVLTARDGAKANCPISQLLRSVPITLSASLG